MTRICAKCKKYLGEKCPHCGSLEVSKLPDAQQTYPAVFRCAACRNHFTEGNGGKTHTLCEDCIQETLREYGIKRWGER